MTFSFRLSALKVIKPHAPGKSFLEADFLISFLSCLKCCADISLENTPKLPCYQQAGCDSSSDFIEATGFIASFSCDWCLMKILIVWWIGLLVI